jgi:hypothetical protein
VPPAGESREANGRGFALQAMWTHYAARHTGVCLVLDKVRLIEAADLAFGQEYLASRVVYVDGYDDSARRLRRLHRLDFDRLDVVDHFMRTIALTVFSKNKDWEGEREFRLVLTHPVAPNILLDVEQALVGIVLGVAFPEYQMPVAVAIGEHLGILSNCAQAYLNDGVLTALPWKATSGGFEFFSDEEKRRRAWRGGYLQ